MRFKNKRSSGKRYFLIFILLILVIGGAGAFFLFFEGEAPQLSLENTNDNIGQQGAIHYTASDSKSGIRSISIWAQQGDLKKQLHYVSFPRTTYTGTVGPLKDAQTASFDVKKEGFKDGPMTITAEVSDFSMRGWFQGNKTTVVKEVTVDTVPPRIQILHAEKYISPGGSGIVIYRLDDKDCTHGVNINGRFNRGALIGDGRDDTYIAFFGLPFDTESLENQNILAIDHAGNQAMVPFTSTLKPANQKHDNINIGDGFLSQKIPEFQQYYPEMTGTNLEKYLYSNNTVRIQNNTKIAELCSNPSPERLWKDAFARMPGSPRAGYADHRTYYYQGKSIDHQVHLGMDIASTQNADVRAANTGIVIFADYLGIYGNMIIIDHGQGVYSLYSHLSQINVKPGDKVDQKTVIGLTGTTGMAGGDHLHFSMLINGVFVTPTEWWDQHWINVTINDPIKNSKF